MTSAAGAPHFRSAFIALIGRPNSGKSTLLNTVIGEEISMVTPLPQTTRCIIRGIYTTDTMQLVFIDTPGVHCGKHIMNRAMLQEAKRALEGDADLVCWVVDISREYGAEDALVADMVRSVGAIPVLVVFNKADLAPSVDDAAKRFNRLFPDLSALSSISISALSSDAKHRFLAAVDPFIPKGPRYFDSGEITDSTMRQIAAEYIRKHVIAAAADEVPHAVFVEIESYREMSSRHEITAVIHVETRGQRGIIVGKDGAVIRRIKRGVRTELTKLTGVPVSISCHVKVSPGWRNDEPFLRRMGVNL